MNDLPLIKSEPVLVRTGSLHNPGIHFFAVSTESEIANIKVTLKNQIMESVVFAKKELTEISQLFSKYDELLKEMDTLEENDFSNNIPDYLSRIHLLFQLSHVLRRIPYYCNFVESNILFPIKIALEKIRTLCGCDLNDVETWKLAHTYTKKICRQATRWELSKIQLQRLFDTVTDEMELFIFNYGTFDERTKAALFNELQQNAALKAWIGPFLELSGSKNPQWEMALSKAISTLPLVSHEKAVDEKKLYV